MTYTVTITSQGQITIPARIRRLLNLDITKKAVVSVKNQKIVIEPEPDIMELSGTLAKYAIKTKSLDQIIKMEEESIAKASADEYRKKIKKSG